MEAFAIYGIRNTVNGKWYIGQTKNATLREKHHFSLLRNGLHWNEHLQSSCLKYGVKSFEFRILERTWEPMIDARERTWISHLKSNDPNRGYNREGGGSKNKHVSEETRHKISEANKGEKHWSYGKRMSAETCQRHSMALKGRKRPVEVGRKISKALTGRHPTPETLLKLSESHKGKPSCRKGQHCSEESKRKMSESAKRRPPFSMETRQRLSRSHIEYWKNKREQQLRNNPS